MGAFFHGVSGGGEVTVTVTDRLPFVSRLVGMKEDWRVLSDPWWLFVNVGVFVRCSSCISFHVGVQVQRTRTTDLTNIEWEVSKSKARKLQIGLFGEEVFVTGTRRSFGTAHLWNYRIQTAGPRMEEWPL